MTTSYDYIHIHGTYYIILSGKNQWKWLHRKRFHNTTTKMTARATPGSSLPSKSSREAPPPVLQWVTSRAPNSDPSRDSKELTLRIAVWLCELVGHRCVNHFFANPLMDGSVHASIYLSTNVLNVAGSLFLLLSSQI